MGTGAAHCLAACGFRVCVTEILQPLAVRREVSFCEAVFEGRKEVEGIIAERASGLEEIQRIWGEGKVALVVDPSCSVRESLQPDVLVDAILAKKNTGTRIGDAPLVIGLGPGFLAGRDAHRVIETNRGHNLARIIEAGEAEPDTGIPGEIAGYARERVLRAPAGGILIAVRRIGDPVQEGETIARIEGVSLDSKISGVLRGILHDGLQVEKGMKVGDVDPRGIREHCFTISDKARAIGGAVLQAILRKTGTFPGSSHRGRT